MSYQQIFREGTKILNKVIIRQEQKGQHREKNILFNIFSFTNQLYQSKSTNPDYLNKSNIYFSKNMISNLIKESSKAIQKSMKTYNKSIKKNKIISKIDNNAILETFKVIEEILKLFELNRANDLYNKIFNSVKKSADLTLNLSKLLF